jgi:hypothetical protein
MPSIPLEFAAVTNTHICLLPRIRSFGLKTGQQPDEIARWVRYFIYLIEADFGATPSAPVLPIISARVS